MEKRIIYADNAATTKLSGTALEAMMPYLKEEYGNPSSLYAFGQKAKEGLESARLEVAKAIGCEPREIYFTSGGSESDNQALTSLAASGAKKGKKHIISSAFEHHAVLHTLKRLKREGFEVTLLPVHEDGLVRVAELEEAIRPDTLLSRSCMRITKSEQFSRSKKSEEFAVRTAFLFTRTRCRRSGISP